MTENVYWILKGTIAEGALDAMKEVAADFCAKTTNEPGALAYEWSVSADGSEIHIFEQYAEIAAFFANNLVKIFHYSRFHVGILHQRFSGGEQISHGTAGDFQQLIDNSSMLLLTSATPGNIIEK